MSWRFPLWPRRSSVVRRMSKPGFALGRASARLGRAVDALAHLGRISADADRYVQARLLMAQVLLRQGEHRRAERTLVVALKANPTSVPLIAAHAEVLTLRGDAEVALQAVQVAREAAPLEVDLWSLELMLFDGLQRAEEAGRLLSAAQKALPNGPRARLLAEHVRRVDAKRTGSAIAAWVSAAPQAFEAQLAFARHEQSEGRSGIDAARAALGKMPRDPRALATLAIALERDGDHSFALEHIGRAVRLDPWDAEIALAWHEMAAAYDPDGGLRRAFRVASRALRADQKAGRPGAAKRLKALQRRQRMPRRPRR